MLQTATTAVLIQQQGMHCYVMFVNTKIPSFLPSCTLLNDQTLPCPGCCERGAAIAKLCHEFCIYVEKERDR